jgi:hypothetical protein
MNEFEFTSKKRKFERKLYMEKVVEEIELSSVAYFYVSLFFNIYQNDWKE